MRKSFLVALTAVVTAAACFGLPPLGRTIILEGNAIATRTALAGMTHSMLFDEQWKFEQGACHDGTCFVQFSSGDHMVTVYRADGHRRVDLMVAHNMNGYLPSIQDGECLRGGTPSDGYLPCKALSDSTWREVFVTAIALAKRKGFLSI